MKSVRVINYTCYFNIHTQHFHSLDYFCIFQFDFYIHIYNEDSISVIEKTSVDIVLKYKHINHNLKRSQNNNVILEEVYFFVNSSSSAVVVSNVLCNQISMK